MLYSLNGQHPQTLPFRIRFADGRTRTDPTTFTLDELVEAGYVQVEDPPEITEYQRLLWDSAHMRWVVQDFTEEEIAAAIQTKQQRLIESIRDATQQRLDAFAQTRNYDGILSACTYATSTIPKFQQEGQYCVLMRDQTWAALYSIWDDVLAGNRLVPSSYSDIESELPTLQWPT